MKKVFISVALLTALAATAASAKTVPCEDNLANLRAAEKSATIAGNIASQVKTLEDKGIERCNADDDKRANDFFLQAMKLIGQ